VISLLAKFPLLDSSIKGVREDRIRRGERMERRERKDERAKEK
jgi:hypothetical protein